MKPAALEPRTARIATWTLLAWEQDMLEGGETERGGAGAHEQTFNNHIPRL